MQLYLCIPSAGYTKSLLCQHGQASACVPGIYGLGTALTVGFTDPCGSVSLTHGCPRDATEDRGVPTICVSPLSDAGKEYTLLCSHSKSSPRRRAEHMLRRKMEEIQLDTSLCVTATVMGAADTPSLL